MTKPWRNITTIWSDKKNCVFVFISVNLTGDSTVRAYKMKIADFTTAGIPTKNVWGRYLAAIKEKLEQTRDQGPQFPGYRECQELLHLVDLNQ